MLILFWFQEDSLDAVFTTVYNLLSAHGHLCVVHKPPNQQLARPGLRCTSKSKTSIYGQKEKHSHF